MNLKNIRINFLFRYIIYLNILLNSISMNLLERALLAHSDVWYERLKWMASQLNQTKIFRQPSRNWFIMSIEIFAHSIYRDLIFFKSTQMLRINKYHVTTPINDLKDQLNQLTLRKTVPFQFVYDACREDKSFTFVQINNCTLTLFVTPNLTSINIHILCCCLWVFGVRLWYLTDKRCDLSRLRWEKAR